MSKKGSYIGGHTVLGKNSSFFWKSKKDNTVKTFNKDKKKQIKSCIQNIILCYSKENPYPNKDQAVYHFLKEISLVLFTKSNLGSDKNFFNQTKDELLKIGVSEKFFNKVFTKKLLKFKVSEDKKWTNSREQRKLAKAKSINSHVIIKK